MRALHIIIKPVVTEKATNLSAKLTYAFWVNRAATKIDIKQAIQEAYGVDVKTVRTMHTPAKTRMLKRSLYEKRSPMKKAFVTLKGGKKLDVTKIGKETKAK